MYIQCQRCQNFLTEKGLCASCLEYTSLRGWLLRHIEWSAATFGPGPRTEGLCQHITKELEEIRREPTDLEEWIDVVILALDGAWRAGHPAHKIVECLDAKLHKNRNRKWPPPGGQDQPIEHLED